MRAVMLPRQAGKTRILVDNAEDELRKGHSVLVIAPNHREASHLRHLILKRFEERCPCCGSLSMTKATLPQLVVTTLPYTPGQSFDVCLIDNLDIVLQNVFCQPVDLATFNKGEG